MRRLSRRTIQAADVDFDVADLAGSSRFDLNRNEAEEILKRIDRGASLEELADFLGLRVEKENHPLAQKNPLYYFLTRGGEGDVETIVYFPDEDTFYLAVPNYLYGDEDGELVSKYINDHFGDGLEHEMDIGFSVVCDADRADAADDMLQDLDGAGFDLELGTMEVRRFEIANQEKDRDVVTMDGGCLVRVRVPGDEAVDALFTFYDGDLYADARRKAVDLLREFLTSVCEKHAVNTLRSELEGYCKNVSFIDVV